MTPAVRPPVINGFRVEPRSLPDSEGYERVRARMRSSETLDREPLRAFDWTEAETPSSAVVAAVSDVSGDDPTDIEPLYDVVDPDSLDDLFAPARSPRLTGAVRFEYHGYPVTVTADGRGFVHERAAASRDSTEEYR